MKKVLFLLLVTTMSYGQALFDKGVKITGGQTTTTSTNKIISQEANGVLNHIPATSLPISTATANALDLRTENSAGAIQGFAITNNGNGTVNIATGTAYLRTTNDPYSPLIKYVIPAVTNLALTVTTAEGTINTTTNSIAYVVSRVGTTLDYISLIGQNVDANGKLRRRFLNSEGLRRAQGAVLTGSNRNLLLTAGLYYSGLIEVPTPSFNTSTVSTFTQAYINSTWVRTTGNTQINNTQYSSAGVLTTMPTNDYRVDYVYLLADNPSKMYVLLGSTTYANINDARLAPVPTALPTELQFLGTRVGRVIIRKDAVTMEVSSEFATIYQAGSATLHNDLGGLNLGDFQHLTVAEKDNLELKTNKQNSLTVDGTGEKYPTVDAINNALPKSYSNIVYVNATSPTTATIFDTNNPPVTNNNALKLDVNNLYIGNDASTWVYITSPAGYVTKVIPATSNFNILNTGTDAGNSKVANLVRNGSLTILNDITALTNIRSSANNLILHDTGGVIFRGVRAPSWADNLSSRFFQIGNASDNVVLTTQNGNNANRMMFASQATQFQANGNYTTSPAPLGIFEIVNGTTRLFNLFSDGNLSLSNSGLNSGFRLDINGTTRLQNTVTLSTSPTTSAGTFDVLTRNISTGVVEKRLSSDFALASNSILTTGNQTATGRKTFTSDNTNAGGISILNSKTTFATQADAIGVFIDNTGAEGLRVNTVNTRGAVFSSNGSGIAVEINASSTGIGLSLRKQTGSGDLLNAEGVTRIVSSGAFISDDITANGLLKLKSYTVATLPAGVQGATAYVTDATAPTYLGALIGGGTVRVPVFFNGTIWVSH